jgi:hypothetical protein
VVHVQALWVVLGALVIVGVVVGLVGLAREDLPNRSGALRIGLALGVLVPLAVVVSMVGDARIDVEVPGRAPSDADAWSVSCDTFQAPADDGEVLQAAFHDACADATRPARWTAIALVGAAAVLALDGVRRLLAPRPGPPVALPVVAAAD